MKTVIIDNYDSFTYNLAHLVKELGAEVEVKDDATAGAITARAFKKGLVIERAGRDNAVIKIMPPLIISDEDLIAGLDILKAAIDGE